MTTSQSRIEQLRDIVRAPPGASSTATTRTMLGNRRRDSVPELRLRSALHRLGLRYRVDHPIRVADRRPIRPDVVFTRARLAVFVDGCFWHGCPEHGRPPRCNATYWAAKLELNRARDREQDSALADAGWAVVRIWEHESADVGARIVVDALRSYAARDSAADDSASISIEPTA